MKKKISIRKIIFYVIVFGFLIIQIYPVIWLFLASVRPSIELANQPFAIPKSITFVNYMKVILDGRFSGYIVNSLLVMIESVVLIILLSSTVAYAITKFAMPFNKHIYSFFTMGIMIPIQITLIPLFIFYSNLNILNTKFSLVMPQVGFALPLSVMLFVSFYSFVPNEIIEAAIIDGCSAYRIFWKIVLPLSKNTVITVASMYSIFIWNDFIFANTFISDSAAKTVAVGLRDYVGAFGNVDWGSTYAAIGLSVLPPMLIYFFLNKWVTAGMTMGSTK